MTIDPKLLDELLLDCWITRGRKTLSARTDSRKKGPKKQTKRAKSSWQTPQKIEEPEQKKGGHFRAALT